MLFTRRDYGFKNNLVFKHLYGQNDRMPSFLARQAGLHTGQ
jgi:hypothetical protein